VTSVNSISSSPALATAAGDASRIKPSKFEVDSDKYGPVVASAIGVGDAITDGASAICSFSSHALDELASAAGAARDTLAAAAGSVGSGLSTLAGEVGDAVHSAAQRAGKVVDQVEGAVSSLVDGVEDVAGSAAGYVTLGIAAGKQVIDEIA